MIVMALESGDNGAAMNNNTAEVGLLGWMLREEPKE